MRFYGCLAAVFRVSLAAFMMSTAFAQTGKSPAASENKQEGRKEQSKESAPKSAPQNPIEDPNVQRPDSPPAPDNNRLLTLDPKTVIGEVNGQPVRLEDINRIIDFGNESLKAQTWNDVTKKNLLQQYLEYQTFYYEALAGKVDQDPGIQGRLELFRQQLYANFYLSQEAKKIKPTEEDLKKHYDENRKEFEVPENVNASHILVKTEAEAKEIRKQLDAGADFAALAKQHSLDTTNKDNGGNLGFFMRGAMLQPFEEAAFKLKPGQISDPVQTTFGWHVIKVTEVRPRTVQSFDEARKTLEPRLTAQLQRNWFEKKREELKNKYGVKVYEQYFAPPATSSGTPAIPVTPPIQDNKGVTPAAAKPVPPSRN